MMLKRMSKVMTLSLPVTSFLIAESAEPNPHSRKIGLAVLRGPQVTIISPVDGSEEIDNPFASE